MRRLPIVLALAVFAASCGGTEVRTTPRTSPTLTPAPSPSATSPASSPTPSPVTLPPGVPSEFTEDLPAEEVPPGALVPEGSQVTGTWYVPESGGIGEQIVVAWATGADPFRQEHGLALWQRHVDDPPWRAAYAFLDKVGRGVLGIRAQLGDLTADGHEDVLSFEDTGGSGACGVWRVLATVEGAVAELYHRQTCDTDIVASEGTLIVTEAVFEPADAHCCPSATRTRTLRWGGTGWEVVDQTITPN
ncbi:MAG: hypothetical protein ACT4PO_12830 [Actinomycetota bacterium]